MKDKTETNEVTDNNMNISFSVVKLYEQKKCCTAKAILKSITAYSMRVAYSEMSWPVDSTSVGSSTLGSLLCECCVCGVTPVADGIPE